MILIINLPYMILIINLPYMILLINLPYMMLLINLPYMILIINLPYMILIINLPYMILLINLPYMIFLLFMVCCQVAFILRIKCKQQHHNPQRVHPPPTHTNAHLPHTRRPDCGGHWHQA